MNSQPISGILDGIVHKSAAADRLPRLRQRAFFATHLTAGLVVLTAIPIWMVVFGPMSIGVALTFSWLAAPMAIAFYLSRAGNPEAAHLASAAASEGLIVWLAAVTRTTATAYLPIEVRRGNRLPVFSDGR